MEVSKIKVLVTGGAGFIGSKLSERLINKGYEVYIIDNLSTGKIKNLPQGCHFIEKDLSNDNINNLLPTNIKYVFHFAAQSSGEISFDNPEYDLKCNVLSTLKLLKWSRDNKVKRFVFASSMNVYGDTDKNPIIETEKPNPKSFYGVGKYSSEQYIKIYSNLGVNSTILRFFNIYGPGQNLDNLKQGMISIYLAYIINNKKLLIKGSLERFRDFVYIDDAIEACLKSIEEKTLFSLYNICSGKKTTINELIKIILKIFKKENYSFEVTEGTPFDQFGIYGNPKFTEINLHWKVKTKLEEGIKNMIKSL